MSFSHMSTMPSRIFALIIGIDNYKSGGIWNLHSCSDDAKKIRRWLMDDLCVRSDHISLLIDQQATRKNIEDQFAKHFLNNHEIERGDAILIYFAGHGSRLSAPDDWYHPDVKCDTVDVLCTYDHDTNTQQGRQAGISDHSLQSMIQDLRWLKGDNTTLILDCCFAPTQNRANVRDRSITRWTKTVKALPNDLYTGLWPNARGTLSKSSSGFCTPQTSSVVLAACSNGEKAVEDKSGGRFTTSFLHAVSMLPLHRTSYVQVVERASQINGDMQSFVCTGKNKDEVMFNEIPFPIDNALVSATLGFDSNSQVLEVAMGAIHGLTKGSELSLHLHNRQHSRNPSISTAFVSEIHPTWSFARLVKPLSDPPHSCWAKVTKWSTRRPFLVHIRSTWSSKLSGISVLRRSLSFNTRERYDKNMFEGIPNRGVGDTSLLEASKGNIMKTIPVIRSRSTSIMRVRDQDPAGIDDYAARFNLYFHATELNTSAG